MGKGKLTCVVALAAIFMFSGRSLGRFQQFAFAPVLKYSTSYRGIVGGSFLFYPYRRPTPLFPGFLFGMEAATTFDPFFYIKAHGGIWSDNGIILRGELDHSELFDPYYGEGSQTPPNGRVDIDGNRSSARVELLYNFFEGFNAGIFTQLRFREEHAVGDNELARLFPRETTTSFGLVAEYDTRPNFYGPNKGMFHQFRWTHIDYHYSSRSDIRTTNQFELDFRFYRRILGKMLWALRLNGAASWGDPSYPHRYRLGGEHRLRGYRDNRFRGKHFYVVQQDFRIPLWKGFGLTYFLDMGEATDRYFKEPRVSGGMGIRFSLYKDEAFTLRVDAGWGTDQQEIVMTFGQAF